MRFVLEIACDNAAFEGENLGPELARILRREADGLVDAVSPEIGIVAIQDVNGNKVGRAVLADS